MIHLKHAPNSHVVSTARYVKTSRRCIWLWVTQWTTQDPPYSHELRCPTHLLTCAVFMNSAMSALHAGQGLTVLRTRSDLPLATSCSSPMPANCLSRQPCNAQQG